MSEGQGFNLKEYIMNRFRGNNSSVMPGENATQPDANDLQDLELHRKQVRELEKLPLKPSMASDGSGSSQPGEIPPSDQQLKDDIAAHEAFKEPSKRRSDIVATFHSSKSTPTEPQK